MQGTMNATNVLNDQIIATDLLMSAKTAVRNYAYAITEAATPEVRNTLRSQLNDAIQIHEQISRYMIEKGYYHPNNVQEQLRIDMQAAQQVLQANNVQ